MIYSSLKPYVVISQGPITIGGNSDGSHATVFVFFSFFPRKGNRERIGGKKMEESKGLKKVVSACDVEALKKCLEENKGDYVKCQSQIEAFKSSCSLSKHSSTTSLDPQTKTT
ncbi:hypothetical protein DKX38_001443 [Salix brachista]|uniref:Uncharacterized protein n=1 Tax=Salix brachista TaxID=2182728 RepID=A0A5N5P429_9ROSI|nr:hypothetical protein DKX38_001443 [Salix brachista]